MKPTLYDMVGSSSVELMRRIPRFLAGFKILEERHNFPKALFIMETINNNDEVVVSSQFNATFCASS